MIRLPDAFFERSIAHRALHDVAKGRPENSIAAISAAIQRGFGIEIDVQMSADQNAVVFHDYDLSRLTAEAGQVVARRTSELSAIRLTGGTGTIPTLQEVLELVDGQVPLLIEVKDQDGAMGPSVGPLEQAVADTVRSYSGPLALMSFNPHAMLELQRLLPDVPRGLVTSAYREADWGLPKSTCDRLRDIPDYTDVGASFISHEASDLSRARVLELKASGASVLCWTVRSPAEEADARQVAQNVTFEGYLPAT